VTAWVGSCAVGIACDAAILVTEAHVFNTINPKKAMMNMARVKCVKFLEEFIEGCFFIILSIFISWFLVFLSPIFHMLNSYYYFAYQKSGNRGSFIL
jgi:hypothetical protein